MKFKYTPIFIIAVMFFTFVACQHTSTYHLKSVAESQEQWTGISMSKEGRIFVNYPRWSSDTLAMSVAEIINGKAVPYPNQDWNNNYVITSIDKKGNKLFTWNENNHFVCVQSVYVDKKNRLWILDPANPHFYGVVAAGPKLYQVDLATDSIIRIYNIPFPISKANSYLNDIRIDTTTEYAFITDSNVGGIYVLNLKTGEVSLKLFKHISTLPEIDTLQCGKYLFTGKIHTDGIELSQDGSTLYYSALMGKTLYSVPTKILLQEKSDSAIATHIKKVANIPSPDGFILDNEDNIWAGDLAHDAIFKVNINTGNVMTIIQDTAIRWADSFAKDHDGNIYFTTSQIQYPLSDKIPHRIFKIEQ